jgi:hypothetical protein
VYLPVLTTNAPVLDKDPSPFLTASATRYGIEGFLIATELPSNPRAEKLRVFNITPPKNVLIYCIEF